MPTLAEIKEIISKAITDYAQLKKGYPNANKFASALKNNIMTLAPPDPRNTNASMEFAMNRALDAPMLGAIKAYHGSPYRFNKFDMDKIGAGEGAQAYGHGLYFADNPDVAKNYVVNDTSLLINGEKVYANDSRHFTATDYLKKGYDQAKKDIEELILSHPGNDWPKKRLEMLEDFKNQDVRFDGGKGQLYETSLQWPDAAREAIDPLSPKHFIDFDKTLGEQSQYIKDSIPGRATQNPIKAVYQAFNEGDKWAMDWAKNSGLDPYSSEFGGLTSNELATMYLRSKGIPGTRYLDQGSRSAGNGTYNYVVFDDKIPKIISINGKGLLGEVKK